MADSCLGPPIAKSSLPLLLHSPSTPTPTPKFLFHFFPSSSSSSSSSSSFPKPKAKPRPLVLSMASLQCPCFSSSISNSSPRPFQPSLLVFSGGTAFNGVVEELKKLTTRVAHVLPVSDDGGSTAEIVRVLGGPAVGDIRSRCLRMSDQSTAEALAVRRLLGHRLPLHVQEAKSEWYNIVEGEHSLWEGVSRPYSETIRAFLVYFQNEILRRPNESFCFSNGSIGNFFFAGARIFFQSLDAAIFLFSRVSDIPAESLVLPVISTNDRLTLGCELWDGNIIRGQNEISHPTNGSMQPIDKGCSSVPALPSRIKRVFYMSSEGGNSLHEVFPTVNASVLDQLSNVDCIVYAMGSLFTSICPSLVLRGIGEIISSRNCPKVLLLNGTHDRETRGFSASGFVTAITDALNRKHGDPDSCLENFGSEKGLNNSESPSSWLLEKTTIFHLCLNRQVNLYPVFPIRYCIQIGTNAIQFNPMNNFCLQPNKYINTLLVPKDGEIPIDVQCLTSQGIFDVIMVDSVRDPKVGVLFNPKSLIDALANLIGRYMSTNVMTF